jgi:hypothetical protein
MRDLAALMIVLALCLGALILYVGHRRTERRRYKERCRSHTYSLSNPPPRTVGTDQN